MESARLGHLLKVRQIVIALLLACVLMGACGSDDSDRVMRTTQDVGVAEFEDFADVSVPGSASEFQAETEQGIDQSMTASFVIESGAYKPFIRKARLKAQLREVREVPIEIEFLGLSVADGKFLFADERVVGQPTIRSILVVITPSGAANIYATASEF